MLATLRVRGVVFDSDRRVDVRFDGYGLMGHGVMGLEVHVPPSAAGLFRCGETLTLTEIDQRLRQIPANDGTGTALREEGPPA